MRELERAVLREALGGATRIELWLAARIALKFVTEEQFRTVLTQLVNEGDLKVVDGRWQTTASGRARLGVD